MRARRLILGGGGSATLYKLYTEVLGAFLVVTETIEVMNI